MSAKKKKKKANKPLSEAELARRRAQRARTIAAAGRLLYSRKQTAFALGNVSIATILRLEQAGKLTKHRLTDNGAVFHAASEVIALAGHDPESSSSEAA